MFDHYRFVIGRCSRQRFILDSFPGGEWGNFMAATADLLDVDAETTSGLRRLVLDELNGEAVLDDDAVDALVRGIASLLEPSLPRSSD
jgi:hypothetical protein